MGLNYIDQFTLLHFSTGISAYFWNIPFIYFIIIHILFEIFENTNWGINIINNIKIWPGRNTNKKDSILNYIFDNIAAILGFYISYYLDKYGSEYNWYKPHIDNPKFIN